MGLGALYCLPRLLSAGTKITAHNLSITVVIIVRCCVLAGGVGIGVGRYAESNRHPIFILFFIIVLVFVWIGSEFDLRVPVPVLLLSERLLCALADAVVSSSGPSSSFVVVFQHMRSLSFICWYPLPTHPNH